MKKMFLENLPKKYGIGINKGKLVFDWKNSIGSSIHFIYNDIEGDIYIMDYNNNKLKINYNDIIMDMIPSALLKCKLGGLLGKITSNFKIEIGQTFKDDKRDLNIIDREYRKDKNNNQKCKYYKYHCNKCGAELWMIENNILKGYGCACCCNPPRVVVKGINDINTTHPELVKYLVNKEEAYTHTYSSNDKVLLECPNCGHEKYTTINNLYNNGFSCSVCSDGISYPNKFMYNILKQFNIEFVTEYSPRWCNYYNIYKNKYCIGIYDFYIQSKNLIIEMDGAFHKMDNKMSGLTKEESNFIDNTKDRLAEEYNLKVIRISCDYDKIENRFNLIKNNIINSKINKIFDLNNIDFEVIKNSIQKSLVKEICEYWKLHNNINHENLSVGDIEKIFNIHKKTIRRYLNIGTRLNWCSYNPQEEIDKKIKKQSKPIEVFKNEKSLGIFNGATYLSRHSEELLGVKLYQANISHVANGEIKQYKGFTFKYI